MVIIELLFLEAEPGLICREVCFFGHLIVVKHQLVMSRYTLDAVIQSILYQYEIFNLPFLSLCFLQISPRSCGLKKSHFSFSVPNQLNKLGQFENGGLNL